MEEVKNQTEEIENQTEEIEIECPACGEEIGVECPLCKFGTIKFKKDKIKCDNCDAVWVKEEKFDMRNHRYCHFRVQEKNLKKDIKFTKRHEAICKKCKFYTEYGECLAVDV